MGESDLQRAVIATLGRLRCRVMRLNSGSKSYRIRGCEAGTPDLLVLVPNGRCVWLELKQPGRERAKGKTADAQTAWRKMASGLGHAVHVVTTVQGAANAVMAHVGESREVSCGNGKERSTRTR